MANYKFTGILMFIIASVTEVVHVAPVTERTERELMLEAFKMQILQKLGMERPPSAPAIRPTITKELTENITKFYNLEETLQQEYDPKEASMNEEIIQLYPSKILDDIEHFDDDRKRYRIVFSLPQYQKKRMRKVNIDSAILYLYVVGKNDSDCVLYEESQSNNSDENDTKDIDHEWIDFIHLTDFDQRTSERERNQIKTVNNNRGRFKITIYELNSTNHQQENAMYRRGNNGWWTFKFTSVVKRWQNSGTGRIRLHIDIELFDAGTDVMDRRIITEPCNETDLYHPLYRMFNSDVMNTLPRLDIHYSQNKLRHRTVMALPPNTIDNFPLDYTTQDIPQDTPQDTLQDTHPDTPQNTSQDTPQKTPHGTAQYTPRHRSRRSYLQPPQSCDKFSHPYPCCMVSSTVSFEELGLDWIIAPTSFTATYCTGTCSQLNVQSSTSTFYYNNQRCGPTETKDLSVLFLDDEGYVVLKYIRNLIVTNCGCSAC